MVTSAPRSWRWSSTRWAMSRSSSTTRMRRAIFDHDTDGVSQKYHGRNHPPHPASKPARKEIHLKHFLISLALLAGSSVAIAGSNAGAVYTATNSPTGNQVLVFDRAANGSLTAAGAVSTGGLGTGAGLGNQSGITLTQNHAFLLVVNAGSDEISSFAVGAQGLTFADRIWSGGRHPISVTTHDNLLYVLNADNITGFSIGGDGNLTPLAGSTRPLSGANTTPAQIGFSGDGT